MEEFKPVRGEGGKFAPGGTQGRPTGSKNRIPLRVKRLMAKALTDYLKGDDLNSDLKELKGKDRIEVMLKIAEFLVPKPKEGPELEFEVSQNMQIVWNEEKTYEQPNEKEK